MQTIASTLPRLSAAELGISEDERGALLWVREELDSGRIVHDRDLCLVEESNVQGFNMGCSSIEECGTVACIGGWMAIKLGIDADRFVTRCRSHASLGKLFYPRNIGVWSSLTPAEAVRAIDFWMAGQQQDCWLLALKAAE